MIKELQQILVDVNYQSVLLENIIMLKSDKEYKDKLKEIQNILNSECTSYNIDLLIKWHNENSFNSVWANAIER